LEEKVNQTSSPHPELAGILFIPNHGQPTFSHLISLDDEAFGYLKRVIVTPAVLVVLHGFPMEPDYILSWNNRGS
jgi:hypothetical protein